MAKEFEPIPIPFSERLKSFQHRGLPFVIFLVVAVIVAMLWDERVNAPGFTGQVVADSAMVISPYDGQVAQFYFDAFDRVERGDPIAQIIRVDSAYLNARLQYINAQIRQIETGLEPIIAQQRNVIDYENLRMENLQARIELASLRIREPQLEAQYNRAKEVFARDGISEEELQIIESEYLMVKSEIEQRTEMVDNLSSRLEEIEKYIMGEDAGSPLSAAIDVFEKELRVVETELQPVTLYAPISGVISRVFKRNGHYVVAGTELFEIEATEPSYIVGYVKQPFNIEPEERMEVQVRTRKPSRDFFTSYIMKVGGHIEVMDPALARPGVNFERGLPVQIALTNNADIKLFPGEIVDVVIIP